MQNDIVLTNSMKQANPNSLFLKPNLHPPEAVVNRTDIEYIFYCIIKCLSEAIVIASEAITIALKAITIALKAITNSFGSYYNSFGSYYNSFQSYCKRLSSYTQTFLYIFGTVAALSRRTVFERVLSKA